jgi:hypothetical protein
MQSEFLDLLAFLILCLLVWFVYNFIAVPWF